MLSAVVSWGIVLHQRLGCVQSIVWYYPQRVPDVIGFVIHFFVSRTTETLCTFEGKSINTLTLDVVEMGKIKVSV